MQAAEMHDRARELRRRIQAIRIKRLGWSDYVFYEVISGLGYGRSLTALGETELESLHDALSGYRKSGKPAAFEYDRQGRYMYHLQCQAGWNDTMMRQYLTVTYKKTHWNLLDKGEKRAVIALLKGLGTENTEGTKKAETTEKELDSGASPE